MTILPAGHELYQGVETSSVQRATAALSTPKGRAYWNSASHTVLATGRQSNALDVDGLVDLVDEYWSERAQPTLEEHNAANALLQQLEKPLKNRFSGFFSKITHWVSMVRNGIAGCGWIDTLQRVELLKEKLAIRCEQLQAQQSAVESLVEATLESDDDDVFEDALDHLVDDDFGEGAVDEDGDVFYEARDILPAGNDELSRLIGSIKLSDSEPAQVVREDSEVEEGGAVPQPSELPSEKRPAEKSAEPTPHAEPVRVGSLPREEPATTAPRKAAPLIRKGGTREQRIEDLCEVVRSRFTVQDVTPLILRIFEKADVKAVRHDTAHDGDGERYELILDTPLEITAKPSWLSPRFHVGTVPQVFELFLLGDGEIKFGGDHGLEIALGGGLLDKSVRAIRYDQVGNGFRLERVVGRKILSPKPLSSLLDRLDDLGVEIEPLSG